MEFGATYPFEERTPFAVGKRGLRNFKGSFGHKLDTRSCADPFDLLPSHARTEQDRFPRWKIHFIRENRRFYETHKRYLKPWLKNVEKFPSSLQKLEWNCQGEERNIWKFIVQMRASGVRLKRPSSVPSLVAMTTTQVPIVAWERRYMTVKECSRVQSLNSLKYWPKSDDKSYKALGNAVNAKLVTLIASMLIGKATKQSVGSKPRHSHCRRKAALLYA
jgi:DNA (cytosine-5)-methyltransferase 1